MQGVSPAGAWGGNALARRKVNSNGAQQEAPVKVPPLLYLHPGNGLTDAESPERLRAVFTDTRHPNLAFAEETVKRVKGKLNALHTPVGSLFLAAFDYNETIVVATAIQLHTLDLNLLPATSQRARELQQCREIAAYFSLSTLAHHNFI